MQGNDCRHQAAGSRRTDGSRRMCCESCCDQSDARNSTRQSCCDSCCASGVEQSKSISLDSISLEFPLSGKYIKTKTKSHSLIHSYVTKNMIKCHKCHEGPKKYMVHPDYSTKTLYKRNNRKRCKKKNRKGMQKDFNNGYKKLYKTDRETIRDKYFRLFKDDTDCVNACSKRPTNEVASNKVEKQKCQEVDTRHLKKLPIPKKQGRKKCNSDSKSPNGNRGKKYIICDDTTCGLKCGCALKCGPQSSNFQRNSRDLDMDRRRESDNLHFKKTCYTKDFNKENSKKPKERTQQHKFDSSRKFRRCEWSPQDSLMGDKTNEYTSYYQKPYKDDLHMVSDDEDVEHYAEFGNGKYGRAEDMSRRRHQSTDSPRRSKRNSSVIDVQRRGTYIISKEDRAETEPRQRRRSCRPCKPRRKSYLSSFKEEDENDPELSYEEVKRHFSTHDIKRDSPRRESRQFEARMSSSPKRFSRENASRNERRQDDLGSPKPRKSSPSHSLNYEVAKKLQNYLHEHKRNSLDDSDDFSRSEYEETDEDDEDCEDSDDDDSDEDDDDEECDDYISDDDSDGDDDDEEISNITYESPENSELELNTEYYHVPNKERRESHNKLKRTFTSKTYKKFSPTESFGEARTRDSMQNKNLSSSVYDEKMLTAKQKGERRESRRSSKDEVDPLNQRNVYKNKENDGTFKRCGRVCQSYYNPVIEEINFEDDSCVDNSAEEDEKSGCFGATDKIDSNRTFLVNKNRLTDKQKTSSDECEYNGPICDDSSDEELARQCLLASNTSAWNKVWKSDDDFDESEGYEDAERSNASEHCGCGCKCHSNSDECSGYENAKKRMSNSKKNPSIDTNFLPESNPSYNPHHYQIYQASSFSVSPPYIDDTGSDGNIFITARFVVSDDDLQPSEDPDYIENRGTGCKCYNCRKGHHESRTRTPSTNSYMNDGSSNRTGSTNKRLSFLNDSYALSQQKMQPQYSQNRKTKRRDDVRNKSITKR